ncbi:FecR family protein [Pedobacter insulae]|uniref:FecR protein n=1 Tax=Pedobacter insulae TaxID=414048 RepID=A0A1I2SW19_9SPHI|nr:FecR family protein [Pedobacter insulae]SFG56079.1 FecR protein [Pedobacter insulae]
MSLTQQNLNHIIQLFEKLQNLSISKDEYDELKRWSLLSEENKQIWVNFHDEELIANDRIKWELFDSELALSNIKRTAKRRLFYRYAAAAAMLFMVFSFSFYFMTRYSRTATEENVVAVNDILPNDNNAVLRFSDDETIVLDKKQNGIQIAKNSISYQNGNLLKQVAHQKAPRQVSLSVPRGSKYEITLDDGTKIWVNAETELRFPETFRGSKTREVTLSGEAYFEVAHDATKPFRVKMSNELIEVLGTSFNLSNYQSDDFTKATLLTGKIALTLNQSLASSKTILLPGQQALYHKEQQKLDILNVDGKKELAWKNGDFVFENEHILTIMKQVERWYDIEVIYKGDFKQSYFSGIVSRSQSLSAVLEMLATTEKLKFKIDKGRREVILSAN